MANSPTGTINVYDWRRIMELFIQSLITFVLTWLLTFIPELSVTGPYANAWITVQPIAILLLTEIAKRYKQSQGQF